MAITGIVCRKANADIMKLAAAYSLMAVALFDGFIICRDEKYRSNVIRPETYINKYMDESWHPLLQTPPFPEYTSGHSVISTAAAAVLINLFGNKFPFDDNTEVEFGLPVKHFSSFTGLLFHGCMVVFITVQLSKIARYKAGTWGSSY